MRHFFSALNGICRNIALIAAFRAVVLFVVSFLAIPAAGAELFEVWIYGEDRDGNKFPMDKGDTIYGGTSLAECEIYRAEIGSRFEIQKVMQMVETIFIGSEIYHDIRLGCLPYDRDWKIRHDIWLYVLDGDGELLSALEILGGKESQYSWTGVPLKSCEHMLAEGYENMIFKPGDRERLQTGFEEKGFSGIDIGLVCIPRGAIRG